ncbi:hypothetical protein OROGR_000947 [Orobanche gracilis]
MAVKEALSWLKTHNFDHVIIETDSQEFCAFIGAGNGLLNCCLNPFEAEAMAVKEALSWLKTHNFDHVIIETDSQEF